MKKFIYTLGMLFIGLQVSAQEESSFNFGLHIAPSISWYKAEGDSLSNDGSKIGFTYGLMADYYFSKNYALSGGLDVTYRNGKLKEINSLKNSDSLVSSRISNLDWSLQYIELPVTIKMRTNEIGYLRYYLNFGLAPGFNIRKKQEAEITTQPKSGATTTVTGKDSNKIGFFNFALVVGGGIEYTISGNTKGVAGLVFNNGFIDVVSTDNRKATSSYLGLNLGVFF
ncbi:MAG: hypothetical protein RIQ89_500 [Bacteroidota bacterium]